VTNGIKVGRLFGIDIRVRAGWFVILGLLTLSLATAVLPAMFEAGQAVYWVLAAVTSLLLFGSVLVHELAHSLVARAQGIRIDRVRVAVRGSFEGEPPVSSEVQYDVELEGEGPPERLEALVQLVDRIAEIPNSLRAGTGVGVGRVDVRTTE